MMPRNPKEIGQRLDQSIVCELFCGFEDGAEYLVPDEAREIKLPTKCGKVNRLAVYVRITPKRFMFERYE